MRITTANTFDIGIDNLARRHSEMSDLQNQISSGKRVTRASDDPAAAARAERALASLSQATNSERAVEASRVAMLQPNRRSATPTSCCSAPGSWWSPPATRAWATATARASRANSFAARGAGSTRQPGQRRRDLPVRRPGRDPEAFPGLRRRHPVRRSGRSDADRIEQQPAAEHRWPRGMAFSAHRQRRLRDQRSAGRGRCDHRQRHGRRPGGPHRRRLHGAVHCQWQHDQLRDPEGRRPDGGGCRSLCGRTGDRRRRHEFCRQRHACPATSSVSPRRRRRSACSTTLDRAVAALGTGGRTGAQVAQSNAEGLRDADSVMAAVRGADLPPGRCSTASTARAIAGQRRSSPPDGALECRRCGLGARHLGSPEKQSGYDAALKSYAMVQRLSLFQYVNGD